MECITLKKKICFAQRDVSLCKTNRFQKSRHCDAISSFTRHRAPCATPSRNRRRHALLRKTKTKSLAPFPVEELASQCRRSVPLRRDGHDDQAINAADNDGRQHSLPAPNAAAGGASTIIRRHWPQAVHERSAMPKNVPENTSRGGLATGKMPPAAAAAAATTTSIASEHDE